MKLTLNSMRTLDCVVHKTWKLLVETETSRAFLDEYVLESNQ